jgi:DNA-binding NtrC family response regulator
MSIARAPGRGFTVMVASSLVTRIDPGAVRVTSVVDGRERVVLLKAGQELLVGTGEDAALRLDDPTVSRAHAKLTGVPAGVRVVDLGSTNGTFYEGAQVHDVVIPLGANIKLGNAIVHLRPQESELHSRRPDADKVTRLGGLVSGDERMKEMLTLLRDVAPLDATVIIEGETGTGKELVARALHDASTRNRMPFVIFDCTAVPKDLIESSLFGHVKGAFTGATDKRQGAFRRAHGGTIFLDELGELPLDLQPKLLRVLESRTVQAVGGDEPEKVDVRVVCATNRDLKEEVRAGRFREDLYYRLAVVKVQLPALRDRPDDIEVLARHFATAFAEGKAAPALVGFEQLRGYEFPGNVRELRNLVERAVSLTKGDVVDLAKFLPEPSTRRAVSATQSAEAELVVGSGVEEVRAAAADAFSSERSFKDSKALVVDAFERAFLTSLMKKNGNLSRASQAAQMDRKHLRELLRRHGLRDDSPEPVE